MGDHQYPTQFNDVDSVRKISSHSGGDLGTYKGLVWYRRHFKLPTSFSGRKIFLEFEGMRQAGYIYLNGKLVGLYESRITAYGIDISSAINLGHQENVLAVKVHMSCRPMARMQPSSISSRGLKRPAAPDG